MGSLNMVQIFINIFLALGMGFLWIRILKPAKDDPRLSRGLQLLQNKIAVLEDLSDRTDHQAKQLGLLLDEKAQDVQQTIQLANDQIQSLEQSMKKSREVAKIFEDRIPHEEIIDRQNTIKYVRAAQMAHQGKTIEEIENAVQIPRSELELIVKVNRDRLMFSVESLPDWVKSELESSPNVAPVIANQDPLARLGEEFRRNVQQSNQQHALSNPSEASIGLGSLAGASFSDSFSESTDVEPVPAAPIPAAFNVAPMLSVPKESPILKKASIQPYQFPRVDKSKG